MSGGAEDNDKQYEPTQKKLDDARKKGEIARSTDLNTAASYSGILLVAIALGASTLSGFGQLLSGMIANADKMSEVFFSDSAHPISGGVIKGLMNHVSPWFLIPGSGLFEFAKSFAKLLIYSIVLALFLRAKMPEILSTVHLPPAMVTSVLLRLVIEFLSIVLLIALAIGAVDFLWQRAEHNRRNMMSRKEMTDETKQSEGDPHMKQKRRQKGYDIAMNQMLADVPEADVIIVNPEHYAVALKWDRSAGSAPICVAKGVDEIAARIREVASENGVPIHRDPPTARTLYATVEIGEEIRPEQYRPVAAAIRFAETMRKKARDITRGPNG
ncbi:MAG: flagellar biosynthesis protein FlhB [Rhodobacterales bacterium]|nr:MAG: flagellar biosynthesis protein FlhB [Rhodobacterales bacterium]